MSITLLNKYPFEGPFASPSQIKNQSGVYVVLGRKTSLGNLSVIDTGESSAVKERLDNHDRKPCWNGQQFTELNFAAYYTDERGRMQIEAEVRKGYNPPCGDR